MLLVCELAMWPHKQKLTLMNLPSGCVGSLGVVFDSLVQMNFCFVPKETINYKLMNLRFFPDTTKNW